MDALALLSINPERSVSLFTRRVLDKCKGRRTRTKDEAKAVTKLPPQFIRESKLANDRPEGKSKIKKNTRLWPCSLPITMARQLAKGKFKNCLVCAKGPSGNNLYIYIVGHPRLQKCASVALELNSLLHHPIGQRTKCAAWKCARPSYTKCMSVCFQS